MVRQALCAAATQWVFKIPPGQNWIHADDNLADALLRARGHDARFFSAMPSLIDLDPLPPHPQVEAAIGRIHAAVLQDEVILICGDYDVDGVSATALLVEGLSRCGARVLWYVPDRLGEGYGISSQAIAHAVEKKVRLIISVDCGIADASKIIRAREAGIDVVVTDHHRVPERLPDAVGIVHPHVYGGRFVGITGVGTAFKLLRALVQRYYPTVVLTSLLDLVALGTVADVAPMIDENRALVRLGLSVMNTRLRPGLSALASLAQRPGPFNEEDIGFVFGPRLNAAGRLDHASWAVRLLLASESEALPLARRLEQLNEQRKRLMNAIHQQAQTLVAEEQPRILALAAKGWHAGVIGIVASKLVEQYGCPVILMAIEGNVVRGSARSIPEVDLYALLQKCNPGFLSFGGHAQAGGFALPLPLLAAFQQRLDEYALSLSATGLGPRVYADAWLPERFLSLTQAKGLQSLRPFGLGHAEPLFGCRRLRVCGHRIVGNDQKHLKLNLQSCERNAPGWDGIGFNLAGRMAALGGELDVLFSLGVNVFNGRESPQLVVKDLRAAQNT